MREYKSGMRWCFFRWTEVRSKYIKRLHILKTPWFAICLHWIMRPDPEPYLHDHPVTFLSLILRGAYAERRHKPTHPKDNGYDLKVHRWYNFIRATPEDRHQIIYTRHNTLTLCFMGPVARQWGYHTDDGWVYWKDYEKQMRREARFEAVP